MLTLVHYCVAKILEKNLFTYSARGVARPVQRKGYVNTAARGYVGIGAALAITACHGAKSDDDAAKAKAPTVRESDRTRVARYPVRVDERFAPGAVERVDDLGFSAPVLRTAARDAQLVGRALKCWPEMQESIGQTGRPVEEVRAAVLQNALGASAANISCGAPKPRNLPTQSICCEWEGLPISPLAQFGRALPLASTLSNAVRQGEVPIDKPPPVMRRRWRSEVRIRPSRDDVVNAALAAVIQDKTFKAAVRGLPIRLTSERSNVLILNASARDSCRQGANIGPCNSTPQSNGRGSVDGIRRTLDPLAQGLTGGRRTWFADGSDFAAAVPIDREVDIGFTVGSAETIEAAVCFIPDQALDPQWRADFPEAYMAQPQYRQRRAILCLLRILGVSGATWDMKAFPRFDDRNLNLVPQRKPFTKSETIVVGQLALGALKNVYEGPRRSAERD
jgi:hypothetical protein